ncbi:type II CAAX prenyl endopeptidase Rce1 family protein [Iamia sp.]|uniref:CPBP family glutamic-type intramembrane protease n=1 Tax=Iamia sp. TaxID=2722710 RepID=UPI002C7022FE|nr:hypothetical protein [Iamia sp.]HXH59127.1 hypothetical protein [Iamia sp.]
MTAGLLAPPTLIRTTRGRAVVLGLAAVTMAVEMASLVVGRSIHIGSQPLSASVLPGLVLLAALGAPSVGRAGDRDRLVPFWIAMAAGLLLGVALLSRTGDLADLLGLVVAAANEEIVYRFAVPVVLATALMVLRVPTRAARVAGYVAAGAWWVLLPGHQAQTDGAVAMVTYASFAVISTVVVARSRALIPMSIAHCVLNVITIAHLRGDITSGGRGALSACLLFLLVGTFAWPGDRPGRRAAATDDGDQDLVTDTVIDLRDGQRPSVHRGEDLTWVDEPSEDDQPEPVGAPGDRRSANHGPPRH